MYLALAPFLMKHTHMPDIAVCYSTSLCVISVCVFSLRNRADKSVAGGEGGRPAAVAGRDKRKELLQGLLLATQIAGLFYWDGKTEKYFKANSQ